MAKLTKAEFIAKVQSKRHANSFPRKQTWKRLTKDLGLSVEAARPVYLAMYETHHKRINGGTK